jgi:hypothetical protein
VVANESAAVQSKINLKAFEASNSGWAGVYGSIFFIFFPRCMQQYFLGQESVDWAPYFYTCVLILLYAWQSLWIGPHTSIRVSSYYYIRGRVCGLGLMLLYMCPHITTYVQILWIGPLTPTTRRARTPQVRVVKLAVNLVVKTLLPLTPTTRRARTPQVRVVKLAVKLVVKTLLPLTPTTRRARPQVRVVKLAVKLGVKTLLLRLYHKALD